VRVGDETDVPSCVASAQTEVDVFAVAPELSVEGTDLGRFFGMEATGKSFRLTATFFFEFKGRLIVRERRIYDFTGMLIQIGVLKARPV
jgi:predicted ester cyclase